MNLEQQVPSIFGAKVFFGRRRRNCFGLRLWVCEMLLCFWNLSMHVSLKCFKAFKIFLVREITLKILFAFPFHLTKQRIRTVFKAILVLALAIWGLDCWGNFLSFFLIIFIYFIFISFLSILGISSFFLSLTHSYRDYLSCHIFQNLQITCCRLFLLLHKA